MISRPAGCMASRVPIAMIGLAVLVAALCACGSATPLARSPASAPSATVPPAGVPACGDTPDVPGGPFTYYCGAELAHDQPCGSIWVQRVGSEVVGATATGAEACFADAVARCLPAYLRVLVQQVDTGDYVVLEDRPSGTACTIRDDDTWYFASNPAFNRFSSTQCSVAVVDAAGLHIRGCGGRPEIVIPPPTPAAFSVTPATVPAGATLQVRAASPCPAPGDTWTDPGAVVAVHDRWHADTSPEEIVSSHLLLGADGTWHGGLTVPASAQPGMREVIAACDAVSPGGRAIYYIYPGTSPVEVTLPPTSP